MPTDDDTAIRQWEPLSAGSDYIVQTNAGHARFRYKKERGRRFEDSDADTGLNGVRPSARP